MFSSGTKDDTRCPSQVPQQRSLRWGFMHTSFIKALLLGETDKGRSSQDREGKEVVSGED